MSKTDFEKLQEQAYDRKVQGMALDLPASVREMATEAVKAENKQQYNKALELCEKIMEKEPEEDLEMVKVLLMKVYQGLLLEDAELSSDSFEEHATAFMEYLDKITLDDVMQYYVMDVLEHLCEELQNQWFLPRFKSFLSKLEEHDYVSAPNYQKSLETIHINIESIQTMKDVQVGKFLCDFMGSQYQLRYVVEDAPETKEPATIDALTFQYYYATHVEEYADSVSHVKEMYPHSYALIADVVDGAASADFVENVLQELLAYTAEGTSKETLQTTLNQSYENMLQRAQEPAYVHQGEGTYKRSGAKVGRNDLCPCGSGKKYKYCCGR